MKDIQGYEGLYAVTEDGKVWSYRRKKFMKPLGEEGNYRGVTLYKDKVGKDYLIHRLVAEAYLPNPDKLPVVNHKDENPSNNHVSNLEWCTYKYNNNYSTRNQRVSSSLKKWHSEHRKEHSASIKKSWVGADERRAKAAELLRAQNKARFAK